MTIKTLLRSSGIAVAAALFALSVVPAAANAPALKPVMTGTAHDELYAIAFHGQVGIAVGAYGELLESRDAGKTWQQVEPVPTDLAILGVGLAQGHAIVVGQLGLILVLQSDGAWKKVASGTKNRLFSVAVQADGNAVAVGAYGTILRSTDGGGSWTSIGPKDWKGYAQFGDQPHIYSVNIAANGAITVSAEFGLILRTTDNGQTWQTVHKGDQQTHVGDASLFGMQIRPDGIGYAVGQVGTVLRTEDGGVTWKMVNVGSSAVLLGVHSDPDGHIVVTGMHTLLVSDDHGKTWQSAGGLGVTASWLEGVASPVAGQPPFAVGAFGRVVQVTAG